MKNNNKNLSTLVKNNLTLTAQVADALRSINKKGNWKNKTNKMTKTLVGKTITSKNNGMTQDDIDKLFKNPSKEKMNDIAQTKVSTEIVESLGYRQHKDFINSVKFLKVDDQWDRLLTGLPQTSDESKINGLFNQKDQEEKDLTVQFKKDYLVGKIIGEGAYASVRVAVFKPLNKKIAIKVYEKNKIREPQRKKSVRREIRILQILHHPNIVKIYDVVETNNHLNIIMEYLPGISLGAYLKNHPNKKVPEKNCRIIFKQLAKALAYMHQHSIAHRDIKLENIILDDNLIPKLIDFGFSTCIEPHKKVRCFVIEVKIFCGTPSYMAPEVVQRKEYRGEAADIWALGVLLFVSLTGIFPFKGATDQELYKKINNADYPKGELFFSRGVNDLISRMLKINPQQRITAKQILNHSWMTESKIVTQSSKKKSKNLDYSNQHRKRINTVSSNHSKQNKWLNKTNKKILAETCKDNLQFQIKMAMKSPSNKKQINSYRKVEKQNTSKVQKSQKTTFRDSVVQKKDKANKTHSKVIDLLRMQIKKRESEKSKSKSRRI